MARNYQALLTLPGAAITSALGIKCPKCGRLLRITKHGMMCRNGHVYNGPGK